MKKWCERRLCCSSFWCWNGSFTLICFFSSNSFFANRIFESMIIVLLGFHQMLCPSYQVASSRSWKDTKDQETRRATQDSDWWSCKQWFAPDQDTSSQSKCQSVDSSQRLEASNFEQQLFAENHTYRHSSWGTCVVLVDLEKHPCVCNLGKWHTKSDHGIK
jgi:hypothetical protein